jgi:transposase
MGNPKGMKRDGGAMRALELRRKDAAVLLRKGRSQADVARELGVSEMSVSRWARALNGNGLAGLRSAGRTGRRPRLDGKQQARIKRVLLEGPEAHGYNNCLWTLPRISDAIRQTCGVTYHPGHVWRLLRGLGWSCQRPSGKAVERDEEAIRRWKRYKWPALKKKPSESTEPSSL